MLEGQVKISFERWYFIWIRKQKPYTHEMLDDDLIEVFYCGVLSEQFGVYVDFFDSVGLMIEIKRELQFGDFYVQINDKEYKGDRFRLRPEARSSSLSKASQIFNERLLSTSTNKENQEKLK